jgi:hypothetical protein
MKAALDFLYEGVASKAIIAAASFSFLVFAFFHRARGHSFFRFKKNNFKKNFGKSKSAEKPSNPAPVFTYTLEYDNTESAVNEENTQKQKALSTV